MALFPKSIDLDEASLSQLRQLYKFASNDLRGIVFEVGKRDVRIVNVRQARALIQQRINTLQQEVNSWATTHVNAAYDRGIDDTIKQLQSYNHAVSDAAAAGIVAGSAVLTQLHRTAADTLGTELQSHLNAAVAQMGRSTDQTLSAALRASIRDRIAAPEATQNLGAARRAVLEAFDENGIYALVDRQGKRWAPDVYADMAGRTVLAKAHTTAISNALTSQRYDLVQVSAHGATDNCKNYEGAILSLTGATQGYLTIGDATAGGLFHVNCKHDYFPANPYEVPVITTKGELSIDEL